MANSVKRICGKRFIISKNPRELAMRIGTQALQPAIVASPRAIADLHRAMNSTTLTKKSPAAVPGFTGLVRNPSTKTFICHKCKKKNIYSTAMYQGTS